MKTQTIILVIVILALVGGGIMLLRPRVIVQSPPQQQENSKQILNHPPAGPLRLSEASEAGVQDDKPFQLTSSAFSHYQPIPKKYTCDGDDISPPLTISGIPKETQSLLLIMDDPDSPSGEFVHWVVAYILPGVTEIKEGTIPSESTAGMTSFGKEQYGGPCPPKGTHRYFFTLYALDTKLGKLGKTKQELMDENVKGHAIGQTLLIGTYTR